MRDNALRLGAVLAHYNLVAAAAVILLSPGRA